MSVSISISVKQNSYDKSAKESNVTCSVIATWKGVSYNRTKPPGTLTINGKDYDFTANFNVNETESGSCTLYSKKLNIAHGSNGNATVTCSAVFDSEVSSGVVKASKTVTLKPTGTTTSSSSQSQNSTNSKQVTITKLDVQSGTDRTVFATWTWSKDNTDYFDARWQYGTGDDVWFVGSETQERNKQSTYSAPSNAKWVRFRVKPVSKKKKVNGKETSYWTGEFTDWKRYNFSENPPEEPPIPTVEIDDTTLIASVDNLDANATSVEFEIVKNDSSVYNTGTANIVTSSASYSCTIDLGDEYKVRCRSIRGDLKSDWSDYSGSVETIPKDVGSIIDLRALTSNSIYIEWEPVSKCDSYEIQYTTDRTYFDSSNSVQSTSVNSDVSHAEIVGIEIGTEWFFRVRAVNENGSSKWTEIKSIILGESPSAPTTWSSTTTAIVGEPLNLYWVHNSEDGSSQTYAELELTVNGSTRTITIQNTDDEYEKDKTSVYPIDTTDYREGAVIKWRVRTRGVTLEYGDWSIQRQIDIYAKPTLDISITDSRGVRLQTLTSFPFYVSGEAGPNTQTPIGYSLSVISTERYETVDQIGNVKIVNANESVYSSYFDTSNDLLVELSAGNIDLENGVTYMIKCIVSMNSGLTAEDTAEISVSWEEEIFTPDAEVIIDKETLTANIRPFCENYAVSYYVVSYDSTNGVYTKTHEPIVDIEGYLVDNAQTTTGEDVYIGELYGNDTYFCMVYANESTLVDGVLLSVYRREYDGGFVELCKDLDNARSIYISDPHPALDYARYRIVAKSEATGAVSYYDKPGEPVGEHAAIIQWSEEWSTFDTYGSEDALDEPTWSGSMLKLPYNIDISDGNSSDVSLVEYIGRKHPVTFYGTQVGKTSTWNMEIPKSDKETLYALRRLSDWMGDVYVREPSGSGYWANISVSYNQTHRELTIPITFNVVRVEGGI